jgi:hypothetical protein
MASWNTWKSRSHNNCEFQPVSAAGTAGDRAEQLLQNSAQMVVSTSYAREV